MGGKVCNSHSDCGGRGGLRIEKQCVCPDAWQCDDCSLTLTDMMYGLKCGMAQNGGGSCTADADCHYGTCEITGDGRSFCACHALYGCSRCEHKIADIIAGKVQCT